MTVILASASPIRHAMLQSAGVPHEICPAGVDEEKIKSAHEGDDESLALALAEAKALANADSPSEKWVIGSDSLVSVNGRRFDKPVSRQQAEEHLRFFSGKTMRLTSAVALAKNGRIDWSISDVALLYLRHLSDAFIHNYLETEWPAVAGCVGVFRFEGCGVQLFDRVEGSHFTILGMPLLPLLGALRDRDQLPR